MWFQFAPDKNDRSQLFYGFPALEWVHRTLPVLPWMLLRDRSVIPKDRQTNVINPEDINDTQEFIQQHIVGVDWTVPAFSSSCLQTNVFGRYHRFLKLGYR